LTPLYKKGKARPCRLPRPGSRIRRLWTVVPHTRGRACQRAAVLGVYGPAAPPPAPQLRLRRAGPLLRWCGDTCRPATSLSRRLRRSASPTVRYRLRGDLFHLHKHPLAPRIAVGRCPCLLCTLCCTSRHCRERTRRRSRTRGSPKTSPSSAALYQAAA